MNLTARARSSVETERLFVDLHENDTVSQDFSSNVNRGGSPPTTGGRITGDCKNNRQTSSLLFNSSSKHSKRIHARSSNLGIRLIHTLRHNWSLLPMRSRIVYGLVGLILVVTMFDALFQQMGPDFGKSSLKADGNASLHPSTTFAVAINTYKRPERLRDAVVHYAEICGKESGINQVFVIWAEQNAPIVPTPTSFFDNIPTAKTRGSATSPGRTTNNSSNRADVYVLQKEKDSLNSRFERISELNSDAVFMVDDDLRVSCSSLEHGFDAWRSNPNGMAGYYPRLASSKSKSPTEFLYHTWPVVFWRHKFNFVLTKASFMHSKYLGLYSGHLFPQAVRDYVDEHMNCEDVAMALLVANHSKYESSLATGGGEGSPAIPIYVEGVVIDRGLFGGISTGGGHMLTRSDCLTQLTAILKGKGWESPLSYEVPLGRYSWIHHSPGFWWQSRPSNFFEWISIGSIFSDLL